MSVVGQQSVKYHNFTEFPGNFCGNYRIFAEGHSFHNRKLGEIKVFYVVQNTTETISHFLEELLRTTDINLHAHYFQ